MKVNCPKCDEGFEVNESLADRKGRCPSCGHVFNLRKGKSGDGEECVGSGSGAGMVWALLLAVAFAVVPFAFIYLWPSSGEVGEAPPLVMFFGRFHVVALHLPIGILVLAGLMEFMGGKRAGCCGSLSAGITVSLWVGALGAVVAVALGYLLVYGEGASYGQEVLALHQWFGVGIAGGAIAALFFRTLYDAGGSGLAHWVSRLILFATLVALVPGSHFGGDMSHGETYLTEHMPAPMKKMATKMGWKIDHSDEKAASLEEAKVFPHVILPILHNKCNACHDANKVKGKLRMDTFELLMEGGDIGDTVVPGDVEKSELIYRILIPEDDDPEDERMPPMGKPQLTEDEIAILKWWVQVGAPDEEFLKDVEQPEELRAVIESAVDLAPQKERPKDEDEEDPNQTTEPKEPVDPKETKPEEPTEPKVTDPAEPVEPKVTEPVEPVEPKVTEPVEPLEPKVTEPVVPKPTEPVDPSRPDEPNAPGEPEAGSSNPSEPDTTEPDVPSEPLPDRPDPVEPDAADSTTEEGTGATESTEPKERGAVEPTAPDETESGETEDSTEAAETEETDAAEVDTSEASGESAPAKPEGE